MTPTPEGLTLPLRADESMIFDANGNEVATCCDDERGGGHDRCIARAAYLVSCVNQMPHDKHGTELAVGDTVMVPCVVKAIHLTEDWCNVDLVTKLTMPNLRPPHDKPTSITLNSRQTIKPTATHQFIDLPDPPSSQRSET